MLGFDLDEFALDLGLFLNDIPDGEVVGRSGRAGGSPTEHIGRGGGAGIYNTGIAVRSLLTGPLVQNKYYSNNSIEDFVNQGLHTMIKDYINLLM